VNVSSVPWTFVPRITIVRRHRLLRFAAGPAGPMCVPRSAHARPSARLSDHRVEESARAAVGRILMR
jgi:hypothetical protein